MKELMNKISALPKEYLILGIVIIAIFFGMLAMIVLYNFGLFIGRLLATIMNARTAI